MRADCAKQENADLKMRNKMQNLEAKLKACEAELRVSEERLKLQVRSTAYLKTRMKSYDFK